jgi:hypothetical protein
VGFDLLKEEDWRLVKELYFSKLYSEVATLVKQGIKIIK